MRNLEDLAKKYGFKGVAFEQSIYKVAEHYSKDYNGGMWESKTLTDDEGNEIDGFYLNLRTDKSYEIREAQNQYTAGDMDSLTFGLAIFSHTCNMYGCLAYENGDTEFANDLFDLQHFCQDNALRILGDEKKHAQYHWFLD